MEAKGVSRDLEYSTGGKLKMLNLPYQLRHKMSLVLEIYISTVAEDLQIRYDHIRVSYVMPGFVETNFAYSPGRKGSPTSWKLLAVDVVAVVIDPLNSDLRSLSSRVEIRPSEPKKQ